MESFVNSLMTVTSGSLTIIDTTNPNEGNVITQEQVATAKGKGWKVYDYHRYDGSFTTVEYEGTGINAIENDRQANDNWYLLDGRRIEQPMKGVYVTKGRKVVMK